MITTTMINTTGVTVFEATQPSAVVAIWLCNQHATTKDFINVHIVPAGQLLASANCIYTELELNPTDTYVIDNERIILSPGDKIIVQGSADEITSCVVSAMEGL